jgi:type I restriction enzyme R subunit
LSQYYKEKSFEDAIEHYLLTYAGYIKGESANFDLDHCLDPGLFISFIKETQPKEWQYLENATKANATGILLDDLYKNMDSQGSLNVLRHGFKCYGKLFRAAYFAPASGMNPELKKAYDANRLTVTRQLHYSASSEKSIDLLISLNGIPVATAELKNPLSGQNVEHAMHQYKYDRDPREKIFEFKKRALVHFAVDPDLVYMTTQLKGESTAFLPFNKGNGTGAGNPENPGNYKTAYLWEQIWQRDSFLDILARFLHLEVTERTIAGKTIRRESMIFPRYHQLDAVRKLEAHARKVGPGTNYLVQHSAGSGKSNSIAWLAYRLASLHNDKDQKVFDSVIVITDRLVLDRQLQDTIYQFEHKQGVVQKIDVDSAQLAQALTVNVPIVITTLQKFPFVTEKVGELPARKYAVIIDEAHSSQSGESAADLKGVLASATIKQQAKEEAEAEGLPDYEEEVIRTMARRGKQPNISFFAFTATPKYKTLEIFGQPGADGKPVPFHLYSMRQAIEEGFILDVLQNYTTYKTYYRLIKSIEDDPDVDKKKAARALARFMSLHPHNIAQKTEVMVEHFRTFTKHKIGGKAKAMVVTSSRLHAVRYKQSFDKYIAEKGYSDIKTLVAFSGIVIDPDIKDMTYTEVEMNKGIKEKELPDKFASGEYQILLVAEKYQTGFDQPFLHTMYVDKKLSGVQAVQTLSRLNRAAPGKEDTFVLDFVNDPQEIYEAFKPYYEQPSIGEQADPHQLYELQTRLEDLQIFHKDEVENFCKVFFKPKESQGPSDHALMNSYLDPAVNRFKSLDEEMQEEFRHLLFTFRNLYSFLSQVIPYQDSDLEKLYTYIRFLLNKLPRRSDDARYHFDSEVNLKYYRLQKISEGAIKLEPNMGGEVAGPTSVGSGAANAEKVKLSRLIDIVNERFGTNFKPADELFFNQIREEAVADESLRLAANANPIENFKFAFDKALEDLIIDRMEQNDDIFTRFMNDKEFKEVISETLLRQVYDQIRTEQTA